MASINRHRHRGHRSDVANFSATLSFLVRGAPEADVDVAVIELLEVLDAPPSPFPVSDSYHHDHDRNRHATNFILWRDVDPLIAPRDRPFSD